MIKLASAILAMTMAAGAQPRDEALRLLKAAENLELVDGNLNAAIKQYGAIVAKYAKTDRAAAATALVRMADCHRKMGDAESQRLYEQVLRDYADQKEPVAAARERLGQPGGATRPKTTMIWKTTEAGFGNISADGRYLPYIDWNTGDLLVRDLRTGIDHRITDTRNTGNSWPTWAEDVAISRDGGQVAYNWFDENKGNQYELRVANTTGEPRSRRIYDNPESYWMGPEDWSPDGTRIAVDITLKDGRGQIGLLSVADGSLRILVEGSFGAYQARFSPDGKFLAFDRWLDEAGARRAIFIVPVAGGEAVRAAAGEGFGTTVGWSPDGGKLLYEATDRSGATGLYAIAVTGGKPSGSPELIKTDLGGVVPLGLTRSGAFHYSINPGFIGGSVKVASFDYATGQAGTFEDVTSNYLELDSQPVWSPDNRFLAYLSRRGGRVGSTMWLVIRSAETGQVVRELRPKLSFFRLAGWAPDSRSLLLNGKTRFGPMSIYSLEMETGEVRELVPGKFTAAVQDVVWAPDGKRLYLKRGLEKEAGQAFVLRDLATGEEKELIRQEALGGINLSPDGKYIATWGVERSTNSRFMQLIDTGSGKAHVAIRVPTGVVAEDLTARGKGNTIGGAMWAPDSRSFLTVKWLLQSQKSEFWRVPVDVGEPSKLDSKPLAGLRLSPDGKRVARVVDDGPAERTYEVWALENFLPSKK